MAFSFMRSLPRLGVRNTFATGVSRRFGSGSGAEEQLLKTALYDLHLEIGGKVVPFAGYALPVQYKESIINNHLHVREKAGLFDVSHMGQINLYGKDAMKFLETLVPSDLLSLGDNQMKLSCFTNAKGGIIDDCIITKKPSHVYMVVNGACKQKDLEHMKAQLEKSKLDVKIEYLPDTRSLIALQGPKAAEALSRLIPSSFNLNKFPFMTTANIKVAGVECWVSRCGYTGEDGFEISIPKDHAVAVTKKILDQPEVQPSGLGVRDSLRLEAGLCLYGHDLNDEISPIQAQLSWLIGKRRRDKGGFLGSDLILRELKDGPKMKRVGLTVEKGAPAREGAEILDEKGNNIGTVTSGTVSPSLKKAIAMGYINSASSKTGTPIQVKVRGKNGAAVVTKMPFVPTKYHKVD